MSEQHWATRYIGTPWVRGGRGPDAFDCYGFTVHVQREHFGVTMLDVDYAHNWRSQGNALLNHDERDLWVRVETPREGDIVLMARARFPVHIGVWIKANNTEGVLHCLEHQGVLFQPARSMPLSGWGGLQYYRRTE